MTQSTSALVRRMVEMGEPGEEDVTDNSGVARICWRRSGEAFRSNQFDGPEETATWVWVRGRAFKLPPRRPLQLEHEQFHWGKPPPAAEPRTLMRIRHSGDPDATGADSQSRARRWRTS